MDSGFVEKRYCTEQGQHDLYTPSDTVFGEVTFTADVDELIRGEQVFGEMYDSPAELYPVWGHRWPYFLVERAARTGRRDFVEILI